MGTSFDITINFSSGSPFSQRINIPQTSNMSFFGFVSSQRDIVSASLIGNQGGADFAIDNFTFTPAAAVTVPEASTFALALPALGMVGTVVIKRRKK